MLLFYFTQDGIICTNLELSLTDAICASSFLYMVKKILNEIRLKLLNEQIQLIP